MVEGVHVVGDLESVDFFAGLTNEDLVIGNILVAGAFEVFPDGLVEGSLDKELITTEIHHTAAELQIAVEPTPRVYEQLQITAKRLAAFCANPENSERVGKVKDFLAKAREQIQQLNPAISQLDRESLLCYMCDKYMFPVLG